MQESPLTPNDNSRFEQFISWLQDNGGTIPSLRIGTSNNGREAFASRSIKAGSLVLHLPRSLLITSEIVDKSGVGRFLRRAALDLSTYAHLAVFILEVKRCGGFWAPYVDLLPASFPTSHYWLADNDLAELAGSYVLRPIKQRKRRLQYEYELLMTTLPREMHFNMSDYIWAICCVESRAFEVRLDGGPKISALVPLADMPDHSPHPNVLWGSESSRGFQMVAAEDIEAGAILTDRYWRECNGLNFVTYGFCLTDNKYNSAEIRLPLLPTSHPCYQLAEGLGVERKDQRVFRVTADFDSERTKALFAYLRLSSATAISDLPLNEAGGPVVPKESVSDPNECEACKVMQLACSNRLSEFKTTIDDDLILLNERTLALPQRLAIQVRCEEKQVLQQFLGLAASGRLST